MNDFFNVQLDLMFWQAFLTPKSVFVIVIYAAITAIFISEICLNLKRLFQYSERFSIIGDVSQGEWHLQIRNVTEDDNGRYECQLHSSNGDAGADILVKIPPKESEFNIFGWQIVKNFVDKSWF